MAIRLGEILLKKNLINARELKEALEKQRKSKTGERLGTILIKMGFIKEEDLLLALSEQLDISYIKLKEVRIDPSVVKKLPAKFAWHYTIMPIKFEGNVLTIATSDPLFPLNDVKLLLGCEITQVLSVEKEIVECIRRYYGVGAETVERIIAESPKKPKETPYRPKDEIADIEKATEDASVINLVNQILLDAKEKNATDIHIEPFRGKMNIRYRIDGVLYDASIPQNIEQFFSAIISRIKIMSRMDIIERRLPQDGRATVKVGGEEVDLRISTIPTRYGEGIVIRLLPTKMLFSLEKLGMEKDDLEVLEELIKKPHGVIFVTGPTGSGKTTTLYTCLNKIKSSETKILTIEDPIEYEIEGISQIQVAPEIKFDFAEGLRSMLRHDPDIMMVGEVRDFETAELTIRAALTGHLIFSTLHTNDAAGGITRLLDIGVQPYLLVSSVEAFIAQRLLRLICSSCKEKDEAIENDIKLQIAQSILGKDIAKGHHLRSSDIVFYKGKGCEKCNFTGFRGRIAVCEILQLNNAIKELILERASTDKIKLVAVKSGMKTLALSGWNKIIQGLTTPAEVIKITQMVE